MSRPPAPPRPSSPRTVCRRSATGDQRRQLLGVDLDPMLGRVHRAFRHDACRVEHPHLAELAAAANRRVQQVALHRQQHRRAIPVEHAGDCALRRLARPGRTNDRHRRDVSRRSAPRNASASRSKLAILSRYQPAAIPADHEPARLRAPNQQRAEFSPCRKPRPNIYTEALPT